MASKHHRRGRLSHPLFQDRRDAGMALAVALEAYGGQDILVLGIPRGGVPVAAVVARQLGAELDVIVARKVGAPDQPEFAIGAVTANGGQFRDQELIDLLAVSPTYLRSAFAQESREAQRRAKRLRGSRAPVRITGRTLIIVDDGLATGATMRAAIRSVRAQRPGRLIVAVPVGASETCAALRAEPEVDDVVCPHALHLFEAVGLHYRDFAPTEESEVQRLLEEAAVLVTPGVVAPTPSLLASARDAGRL